MSTIRKIWHLCLAGAVISPVFFTDHTAAALDTSKPVICAFTNGFDCDKQDGCQMVTPEAAGLPVFIRVDPTNKKVSAAVGEQAAGGKETAIRSIFEADGKLYVQGIERRGWSAVMNKQTGQMTMAASSDNEAIVFFGQCMTPK